MLGCKNRAVHQKLDYRKHDMNWRWMFPYSFGYTLWEPNDGDRRQISIISKVANFQFCYKGCLLKKATLARRCFLWHCFLWLTIFDLFNFCFKYDFHDVAIQKISTPRICLSCNHLSFKITLTFSKHSNTLRYLTSTSGRYQQLRKNLI